MSDRGTEHFHYHSFPRRSKGVQDPVQKGILILQSIANSGLLLVPELTPWPGELKADGTQAEGFDSYHRRVCFTHLPPSELTEHSESFGAISIEFDNQSLRTLGGIPVFYVPVDEKNVGFLGLGLAIASHLGHVHELLTRLRDLQTVVKGATNSDAQMMCATQPDGGFVIGTGEHGTPTFQIRREMMERINRDRPEFRISDVPSPTGVGSSVKGVANILEWLTLGLHGYDLQLGSIKALSGFFSPVERMGEKSARLSYYMQREWRIVGDMNLRGVPVTRKLTDKDKAAILDIDSEFFGREKQVPVDRIAKTVDDCRFLKEIDGKHVLDYARRVICPEQNKPDVRALLDNAGFTDLSVASLESLKEE